jgi:hypothetical protein
MMQATHKAAALTPWLRWFFLAAILLTLAGYWGPWVPHPVSGLVVTGLDLGEYVKFLPQVRGGQIALWREGFYLPLVAVSLAASVAAFQERLRYWWLLRALLLALAVIAALNLLPPAWDQGTFTNPEFRQQMIALGLCLFVMGTSPLWALVPRWATAGSVVVLSLGALWFPLRGFFLVLPPIRELYQEPLAVGWGLIVMVIGLLLLSAVHAIELFSYRTK